ncbi:putative effector 54 [Stemphylium lycopersici]|uniref:Effector 54 n=1 Tax=Stemphylium lycopersici TaxID=183478 RepID=A0A364N548_STELY|nr:hypothetical protein TW65_01570 [Stemphylium lycopersici]RAR02417.1 putative effector 54 [Stemphylium lycopersici]RAR11506.1 effector 54 [Stemphylium lycopersici]
MKLSTISLSILQLACLAAAAVPAQKSAIAVPGPKAAGPPAQKLSVAPPGEKPAAILHPGRKSVTEPAKPPPMPPNVQPMFVTDSSFCEGWHHTFKNGNKIGWCAGCKRLERCGLLLTIEAAACIGGLAVFGPAAILGCAAEVVSDDFASYCVDGIC